MGRLQQIHVENLRPLRELVFEALREAIGNGTLAPGERMMEVQLAEELGVSRTPVREAIRRLELEGYLVMVPRKGAYVASMTNKDVADVFEIRTVLEGLAAELAAERITENELEELERKLHYVARRIEEGDLDRLVEADTEFHDVLYRASRNHRLTQIIGQLREQIQRFRTASLAVPGRLQETLEEHKKIVEAVAERNGVVARRLAETHIENAENWMLQNFHNQEDKRFEEAKD